MILDLDSYELIIITAFSIQLFNYKNQFFFTNFISIVFLFEIFIEHFWSVFYKSNIVIYNLFAIVCCYYYQFLFNNNLKNSGDTNYKTIKLLSLIWLIFAISRYIIYFSLKTIDIINYNTGMIISSLLILKYFYTLMLKNKDVQVLKNPYFYFGVGVLIFYCSSFPIITFMNYLITNEHAKNAYSKLLQIGNIFLSLGYLGAAICIRKEAQSIG
jgi:hypothetical protein